MNDYDPRDADQRPAPEDGGRVGPPLLAHAAQTDPSTADRHHETMNTAKHPQEFDDRSAALPYFTSGAPALGGAEGPYGGADTLRRRPSLGATNELTQALDAEYERAKAERAQWFVYDKTTGLPVLDANGEPVFGPGRWSGVERLPLEYERPLKGMGDAIDAIYERVFAISKAFPLALALLLTACGSGAIGGDEASDEVGTETAELCAEDDFVWRCDEGFPCSNGGTCQLTTDGSASYCEPTGCECPDEFDAEGVCRLPCIDDSECPAEMVCGEFEWGLACAWDLPGSPAVGEAYGPCSDLGTCDSPNICVSSDHPLDGYPASICLPPTGPNESCPNAPIGSGALGYDGACVAICSSDDDCGMGTSCMFGPLDGGFLFCAWPNTGPSVEPCAPSELGCQCDGGECQSGLICVASYTGASICTSPPTCEPGMAEVDGGCVAPCTQGDDTCMLPLECAPIDESPDGFCAWP